MKNKTNRFGRSTRYVPAWSWPKEVAEFLKETITETPILHSGAGASDLGDIRIDKFKADLFHPMDARADWNHLPFKDNAFGAVLMDPPWKVSAMKEISLAYREALRVAPVLYAYAPFLWGARGFSIDGIWVRHHLGVHHPVMLIKYSRIGKAVR